MNEIKITTFLFFFFMFVIGMFSMISMHEETHKSVFEHYGVNSTIFYFPSPKTTPDQDDIQKLSFENYNKLKELQAWVDIIGYHLIGFYISMYFLIFAYLKIMDEKEEVG